MMLMILDADQKEFLEYIVLGFKNLLWKLVLLSKFKSLGYVRLKETFLLQQLITITNV